MFKSAYQSNTSNSAGGGADDSEDSSDDSEDSDEALPQNEQPVTITSNNELSSFIKYFCCSSTGGVLCPTVLLCANKHSKSKQTFFVKEYKGLRISPDVNAAPGYVAYTLGRAGNNRVFQWYFKHVVIPTVVKQRGDGDTPIFISLDGENLIIDSLLDFTCEEDNVRVRDVLEEHNIIIGKLPASWSLSGQPNDVGPLFKVLKQKVHQLVKEAGSKGRKDDPSLQEELQAGWQEYQKKFPKMSRRVLLSCLLGPAVQQLIQ